MIIGHGIDIVEIAAFGRLLEAGGPDYLDRCFTVDEQNAAGVGHARIERLAGRFAAKEAVLKALRIGWGPGIAWTEVEILESPSGAPLVALEGNVKVVASDLGVTTWHLSLSHGGSNSIASAIAVNE